MRIRARRWGFVALGLALVGLAAWRGLLNRPEPYQESVVRRQTTGPITIVLTGDSMVVRAIDEGDDRTALQAVGALVSDSTAAIANVEGTFFETPPPPELVTAPRRPAGTADEVQQLKRLGFNLASCANNHALDHGADGLNDTVALLQSVGIEHAGCGSDLEAARAAAYVGERSRRIAMIGVTTSAAPETRAARRRGDILGRPGVNALRYNADVVADPSTYEVLKGIGQARAASDSEMTLFGVTIRKGAQTTVEFVADDSDAREILAVVKAARAQAEVVVVALHSHEPDNASEAPAVFIRRFGQALIDAGAQIVVGHGPHQLRGIERYKQGVILYSLGDFLYQRSATVETTADVFDAGVDLYSLALGALPALVGLRQPALEEPRWSESAMAIAGFDGAVLQSIRIIPLDLGIDRPVERRGVPRLAAGDRATRILQRIGTLSEEFETQVIQRDGAGIVVIEAGQ